MKKVIKSVGLTVTHIVAFILGGLAFAALVVYVETDEPGSIAQMVHE